MNKWTQGKINECTRPERHAFSVMLPTSNYIHHDVDFSFPFLDDKGPSQGQAFIRVVALKSLPQRGHKAMTSCSLLGPHLNNLKRDTGEEASLYCPAATVLLLMFIQSNARSTHDGAKVHAQQH